MADTKISALTDGAAVAATDRIPVARTPFASGDNRYVTGTEIADFVLGGAGTSVLPVARGGTGQGTEAEALGEMIQALTADAAPDGAADYVVTYDGSADTGKKVLLNNLPVVGGGGRELLTGSRTFYVRAAPQTCTMTIASPAVVTATTHGLSADDPVAFSVPTARKSVTITSANPGVCTANSHGFVAGDPVNFRTTGALPTNLPARKTTLQWNDQDQYAPATYYVLAAGLTANAFQVATTAGGTAINTSAGAQSGTHAVERARQIFVGTATVSAGTPGTINLTAHGLVAGTPIVFNFDIGFDGNTLRPWGPRDNIYYVASAGLNANDFRVEESVGGGAIALAATAANCYVYRYRPLPNNVEEGATYYVLSTGITANTFRFATSVGGSAVNTTGSQFGVMNVATGNDNNDGSAATRTGAFMTAQAAFNYLVANFDLNSQNVVIRLAAGTFYDTGQIVTTEAGAWAGFGTLEIRGASSEATRIVMSVANGDTFYVSGEFPCQLYFTNFESFNPDFSTCNVVRSSASVNFSNIAITGWTREDPHFLIQGRSSVVFEDAIDIMMGASGSDKDHPTFCMINESSRVTNSFTEFWFWDSPKFYVGLYEVIDGGYLWNNSTTTTGTYSGTQGTVDGPDSTIQIWIQAGSTTLPGTTPAITHGGAYYYIDKVTPANTFLTQAAATQTPWSSDIDAAGFDLNNIASIVPGGSLTLDVGSGFATGLDINNSRDSQGPLLNFYHGATNPAAEDYTASLLSRANDSGGNLWFPGGIDFRASDVTNGSEDGRIEFTTTVAGNNGGLAPGIKLAIANGLIVGTGTTFPGAGNLLLSTAGSFVRTAATVVTSLPAAATAGAGARAFVTDATVTTFASVVAGTGSNGVPVYSDGTNWRIG